MAVYFPVVPVGKSTPTNIVFEMFDKTPDGYQDISADNSKPEWRESRKTKLTLKQGQSEAITPQTLNYLGNNQTFETSGYTFTIADARVASAFQGVGINTEEANRLNSTTTLGTNVSKTVIGTSLNITATNVNTLFGTNTQLQTTLTIIGRDSGARVTIPVTITKVN